MSTMIYIPLCFYFIYFPLRHWRRFCHIYIPLCFYFIAASIWGTHSCVAFTFHYASTLSKAEPNKACTRADLHSIMLLLYRPRPTYRLCTPRIYIPLCFYFIICNLLQLSIFFKIYIPLCFYFIRLVPQRATETMNLHSIMLLLYPKDVAEPSVFAINLHSIMLLLYHSFTSNSGRPATHLHSIMLLLYRVGYKLHITYVQIYIPLCFYFIVWGTSYTLLTCKFTFHYASTLSGASG